MAIASCFLVLLFVHRTAPPHKYDAFLVSIYYYVYQRFLVFSHYTVSIELYYLKAVDFFIFCPIVEISSQSCDSRRDIEHAWSTSHRWILSLTSEMQYSITLKLNKILRRIAYEIGDKRSTKGFVFENKTVNNTVHVKCSNLSTAIRRNKQGNYSETLRRFVLYVLADTLSCHFLLNLILPISKSTVESTST